MRLPSVRRLYYDGHDLVLEYGGNGAMVHRYVHGVSGGDDPLVQYNGANANIGVAQMLCTDRLGSIVMAGNQHGGVAYTNSYDEFGVPDLYNGGRFQYAGQQYVAELGLYCYKARMYSPRIGRFMQTDPIGYGDGMNMYAYVGNDPMNGVDPTGLMREICRKLTIDIHAEGEPPGRFFRYICRALPGSEPMFYQTDLVRVPMDGGGGGGPGGGPQSGEPCPAVPADVPGYFYVPLGVLLAGDIFRNEADDAARARFPDLLGTDDARDAFRHLHAAIATSRQYGPAAALGAGNANEFQGHVRGLLGAEGYTPAARAMDDHNNYVGASLGANPAYAHMSPAELADFALANGCAVTSP